MPFESEVRFVEVDDAVVNMKVTGLSMPRRLIQQLGLCPLRQQRARTIEGVITVQVYWPVGLTIQGRECPMDVAETLDDGPVVIGRVPLTALNPVVDIPNCRLIGNPEHGGEPMLEMY